MADQLPYTSIMFIVLQNGLRFERHSTTKSRENLNLIFQCVPYTRQTLNN